MWKTFHKFANMSKKRMNGLDENLKWQAAVQYKNVKIKKSLWRIIN
jgi:hypothetical protein